ncbi:MAG TPA: bacteriophage holin [Gammaproteobacteria bacterium]|nr:bacteriophage holin [Gammaproteobacteria bacterium]
MYAKYTKLHVLAFGFAFGILGAISMFIVGLFAMRGYGVGYVTMLSSLYIGYSATFLGSILGAIWGFLDCFIFGVILAALYNCFLGKCGTCKASTLENKGELK